MKVLITYASAGGGHLRAAEAIFDFLKNNRKNLEVELEDILAYSSPFFRFCYIRGYPVLVHYANPVWGFFFFLTEFWIFRWFSRKIASAINYLSCRNFRGYLEKKDFDFIVSTHFLASELAAGLKLKNKIKSKLVTIITDYGVHPFWLSKGTDLYIAASQPTKDKLLNMGIEEQRIKVFGIPVSRNFNKGQDKNKLKSELGLDLNKFTVLIMTGSFGSGPLEKIAKSLMNDVQILLVCARNKKLFDSLSRENLKNVKVFGFIDNPEELMAVSDVIITKPGGLSIAESLNMGLFPIFISSIPGQEMENIRILASYGIGVFPKSIKQIKEVVLELKDNPQKLADLKNKIAQAAKPGSCQEISSVIR